MANEIYDESWWGIGPCNNIGWGIVYKPYANCESALVLRYIERVEADGGIVESAQCIDEKLNDFYSSITANFISRVLSSSGIIESAQCIDEKLNLI